MKLSKFVQELHIVDTTMLEVEDKSLESVIFYDNYAKKGYPNHEGFEIKFKDTEKKLGVIRLLTNKGEING